jgi:hypothetical protein
MVNQQEIRYSDDAAFYVGIAAMIEHGLTFRADGDNLTIVLTGGS